MKVVEWLNAKRTLAIVQRRRFPWLRRERAMVERRVDGWYYASTDAPLAGYFNTPNTRYQNCDGDQHVMERAHVQTLERDAELLLGPKWIAAQERREAAWQPVAEPPKARVIR